MLRRWDGAAYQDATFVRRWNGTSWVDVSFARRWDGAAWVDVWPSGGGGGLTLTLSVNPVFGTYFCDASGGGSCPFFPTVTSGAVTVTATGGTGGGPTYAWSFSSGDSGIAISSTTAATVTFSASVARSQVSREAEWKCSVTQGVETKDIYVTVVLTYDYIPPGGDGFEPL